MSSPRELIVTADMPGVAVVTGAASGIGRAVAHALVRAGCQGIALLDLNEVGLFSVKASILAIKRASNIQVLACPCDVSDEAAVKAAFETVRKDFSRVDYAINCAGVGQIPAKSDECTTSNWDRTVNINLRGVFLCAREEIRIMKEQPLDSEVYPRIPSDRGQRGAIVNIASGLGVVAMAHSPAYCASKAGAIALTRSDALDHSVSRIRVNSVLPGPIQTPATFTNDTVRQAIEATAVNLRTPMRRWGQADEIADACLFLCSNKASFIQGIALPVDGGYLAV